MRAVIRIQFNNILAQNPIEHLEDFLRLEGFSVVDLDKDSDWLKSHRLIEDKIESFKEALAKPEEKGLHVIGYFFSNNGTEGIIARRSGGRVRLIIYKHNLYKLKRACLDIVEALVEHFNPVRRISLFKSSPSSNIVFSQIDVREDGRKDNIMAGKILAVRRAKNKAVHRIKLFEYNMGRILLFAIFLAISLSVYGNFRYSFEVEKVNGPVEYIIQFAERLTGPLIVTCSVLWFNFWSYKIDFMKSKIVIDWK